MRFKNARLLALLARERALGTSKILPHGLAMKHQLTSDGADRLGLSVPFVDFVIESLLPQASLMSLRPLEGWPVFSSWHHRNRCDGYLFLEEKR